MRLGAAVEIFCYGTSEGVTKSWDTRGRGRKEPEKTRRQLDNEQRKVFSEGDKAIVSYVMRKGKDWADAEERRALKESLLARELKGNLDRLNKQVAAYDEQEKREGKWFQEYWRKPEPERAGLKDEFDRREQQQGDFIEKASNAYSEMNKARRSYREYLAGRLSGDPGVVGSGTTGVNVLLGNGLDHAALAKNVKGWIDSFGNFTKAGGQVNVLPAWGSRSYFLGEHHSELINVPGIVPGVGGIALTPDAKEPVVWHEMGHWLEETTPGGSRAAAAFLRTRIGEQPPSKLNELTHSRGYTDDEIAVKDSFTDAYIGKVYKGYAHTEITSMGMQYLLQDPVHLKVMDEAHYYFTLGMIKARREGGFEW